MSAFFGLLLFAWGVVGVAVEFLPISQQSRPAQQAVRLMLSVLGITVGAWLVWF